MIYILYFNVAPNDFSKLYRYYLWAICFAQFILAIAMQLYQLYGVAPDSKVDKAIKKLKEGAWLLEKVSGNMKDAVTGIANNGDTTGIIGSVASISGIIYNSTEIPAILTAINLARGNINAMHSLAQINGNFGLGLLRYDLLAYALKATLISLKAIADTRLMKAIHQLENDITLLSRGDYGKFRDYLCATALCKTTLFKNACDQFKEAVTAFPTKKDRSTFRRIGCSFQCAADTLASIGDDLREALRRGCQCSDKETGGTFKQALEDFKSKVIALCQQIHTFECSNDDHKRLKHKLASAATRLSELHETFEKIHETDYSDMLKMCCPEMLMLSEEFKKEAFALQNPPRLPQNGHNFDQITITYQGAAESLEKVILAMTENTLQCNLIALKKTAREFNEVAQSATKKEVSGYAGKLNDIGDSFASIGEQLQSFINKLVLKDEYNKLQQDVASAARECERAMETIEHAILIARNAEDNIRKMQHMKSSAEILADGLWAKINEVQNHICKKIGNVRKCNKARIESARGNICSYICSKENEIKCRINTVCTHICEKIQNVHNSFQACIEAFCTEVCKRIQDICQDVRKVVKKIFTYPNQSPEMVCTSIQKFIKAICGMNCPRCKITKTNESCCGIDVKCVCQCRYQKWTCIKCCTTETSRNYCKYIDSAFKCIEMAVQVACKGICKTCDIMSSVIDTLESNLKSICEKHFLINNEISSSCPEDCTKTFEKIREILKCSEKCDCKCCKDVDNNDCCTAGNQNICTCQNEVYGCKCIKCHIITVLTEICQKIEEVRETLKSPAKNACIAICLRIDAIRDACIKACENAKGQIDTACDKVSCSFTNGRCNVQCLENNDGCSFKNGTTCTPCTTPTPSRKRRSLSAHEEPRAHRHERSALYIFRFYLLCLIYEG